LETIPEIGWHFVAVRSYDRQSNQVTVFNPWGDLLRNVSTKDLYNANKEFKISEQKSL
jgi:hypothetical protein